MSFKKNKYTVLKNAISPEIAEFVYKYFLNKREVARFLFDQKYISPFTEYFGIWTDQQVPNTYSHYSDIAMETLLQEVKPVMEKHTGIKLSPTYSYARIYKEGDVLARHKDRYSCEISATLNIYKDKDWPIFADPSGKENQDGTPIELEPGDLMLYKGEEIEHWRETFYGEDHIQVFLHYNKKGSERSEQNKFDTRDFLGLPTYYRK